MLSSSFIFRAFHFVFESDQEGRVVRFPGFGKNSWDISLIFYIQHYPCWAICPWFRVNPLLWFNTSGQPFLIRIMQFRSKSC